MSCFPFSSIKCGQNRFVNTAFLSKKFGRTLRIILMKNCVAQRSRGKGRGLEKEATDFGRASGWGSRLQERLLTVLTSRDTFSWCDSCLVDFVGIYYLASRSLCLSKCVYWCQCRTHSVSFCLSWLVSIIVLSIVECNLLLDLNVILCFNYRVLNSWVYLCLMRLCREQAIVSSLGAQQIFPRVPLCRSIVDYCCCNFIFLETHLTWIFLLLPWYTFLCDFDDT